MVAIHEGSWLTPPTDAQRGYRSDTTASVWWRGSRQSALKLPLDAYLPLYPSGMADYGCPIPATHDRFTEAHYFLGRMQTEYHEPDPFRWNLNAFLQALKSVPGLVNVELQKREGFREWWTEAKQELQSDPLLSRFAKGRDLLVHRGMLTARSTVEAGLFRSGEMVASIETEADINARSSWLLRQFAEFLKDDEDLAQSAADGVELGIRRTWVVEELGAEDDILAVSYNAWAKLGPIMEAGHKLAGATMPTVDPHHGAHTVESVNVMLASDVESGAAQE